MSDLNKPDKSLREEIFGVCKKVMKKLRYDFFTIIDLFTESFVNECLVTQQKENAPLIKKNWTNVYLFLGVYSLYW